MRTMIWIAVVCLPAWVGGECAAFAQAPETAESIMARVAANQDASDAERAHYIYGFFRTFGAGSMLIEAAR